MDKVLKLVYRNQNNYKNKHKEKRVMNKILLLILAVLFSFSSFSQEKIILDTDPSFDPDDLGCMAMLHGMANKGECEILAVVNSTEFKESPVCISAVNNFYNRKAIPVGDYKGYKEKKNSPGLYDQYIANNYSAAIESWNKSVDGVGLYREILASAPDTSITVVIVGTMHNFYGLLQSSPCKFSGKNGVELVRDKVKMVVTMGGNFPEGKGYDRANWGGSDKLCPSYSWACLDKERNAMVRYVLEHCQAPFIASGWEVGNGSFNNLGYGTVWTGQGLKQLPANHIIRRGYEYHFKHRENSDKISRHSNDQCALHFALCGEMENYILHENGTIHLSETGACTWKPKPDNNQGYIQKKRDADSIARDIEALMMSDVQEMDTTPPEAPRGLSYKKKENIFIIHWEEAQDKSTGSWVAYYNVYQDGKLVGKSYGRKYIHFPEPKKGLKFEITSVNVNGLESNKSLIDID